MLIRQVTDEEAVVEAEAEGVSRADAKAGRTVIRAACEAVGEGDRDAIAVAEAYLDVRAVLEPQRGQISRHGGHG